MKAETRSKRGQGVHRHVEPSSVIPGNWPSFLRIEDKKAELFSFLATIFASCTHEEDDNRILLHLGDVVKEGYSKVSIRTVDTDVVVLAVTAAQSLNIT
ncbi:hypothetical protein F7725_015255, partial [Dissostichus mawsoni]